MSFPVVVTWVLEISKMASSGSYWHGLTVPLEQKPSMGTQTCLLFQLHDILYRGSYPGRYSFHCYAFMTLLAQLTTDVCTTSLAEINFQNKPNAFYRLAWWVTLQWFRNLKAAGSFTYWHLKNSSMKHAFKRFTRNRVKGPHWLHI